MSPMRAKRWILGIFCCGAALPLPGRAQDTTKHPVFVHGPFHAVPGAMAVQTHDAVQFNPQALAKLIGPVPPVIKVQRAAGGAVEQVDGPLRLHPGDIAVVRRVSTLARPATEDTVELPFRYLTLSSTGTDTGMLVVRVIRPALQPRPGTAAFAGSISLVVRDSLHPARVDTLLSPMQISIRSNATVDPADFSIGHINLPLSSVAVTTTANEDSISLHLSNTLNPDGADVWIPVARGIALEPVEDPIWGFGLQKTVVHVTLPGRAGPTARSVRLRGADIEPNVLTLSGGQTGSVILRSSGVGTATLWAEADPFQSAPTPIRYSWPILFLVASLLGGMVGSEIAGAGARRRGKGTSRLAYVASGILTGLFVAVAYAIGLNLTGLEIANQGGEAVVFVVAAVGALLGVPGIAKAVPALGRSLEGRAE